MWAWAVELTVGDPGSKHQSATIHGFFHQIRQRLFAQPGDES